MSSVTNARSTIKNSNRTRSRSARYGLRSKSESAASNTPKKDIHNITPLKSVVTPQIITPSTPSSGVCIVCKGIDDLRSLNFKDAVTEFSDKIDAFKHLTKSLNENNSTLNHALDIIKHFILHIEPDKINNSFANLDSGLKSLRSKVTCLPNVTYLESKLKTLENKLSDLSDIRTKVDTTHNSIDSLELHVKPPLAHKTRKNTGENWIKIACTHKLSSIKVKLRNCGRAVFLFKQI